MFKKLFVISLLFVAPYVSMADDETGTNCLQSTRKSLFPFGDEKARQDFCVRISEVLVGVINTESISSLCKKKETTGDATLAEANSLIQQLQFTKINGKYVGSDATAVTAALTKTAEAFECEGSDGIKDQHIKDGLTTGFQENNLVVQKSAVDSAVDAAMTFAQAAFDSVFVADQVSKELQKVKSETQSADEKVNTIVSGLNEYFGEFTGELGNINSRLTSSQSSEGTLTAEQLQDAIDTVREGVSALKNNLQSGEELSSSLKETLKGNVELTRRYRIVRNAALAEVETERKAYINGAEALIIDAWNNFERLSGGDDSTLDPNA